MALSPVTSLSVMSLLSVGYLSWDWTSPNQVENEPAAALPGHRAPHIIFILTDDLGFNDIGYHNPAIRTPTLDKLAAEGVKLENYYVQPICTPSRSQLLTGRYQIHTGLQHSIIRPRQPNCLPFEMVTLPQRLQEAGYSTHMVGKWHLGFYKRDCLPTRRGFDTYFGSLTGGVDYYTYDSCDGPGMCGYDLHEGESVAWGHGGKYSTHLYTRRVRKILASHDPSERPIFLFLSFQAVHTPLQCPKEYIYPYRGMGNVMRRKYAGMVSAVDEAVRNVTYALRKYGYYRNSVIIFSTDNGGQPLFGGSNWPLRGRKGTYWEGGVRGVGFVHSPLLRQRRKVSKALVHITDWYPTLMSLAGGNMSWTEGLDGYNMWETLSEGKESPRLEILHNIDPLYVQARHGSVRAGHGIWNTAVQAAVRMGDWKLLTGEPGYGDWTPPQMLGNFPGGWWELERHAEPRKSVWLFNISGDPYERYDLAEQRPDVVKQLLARLAFYNRTAVPVRYPPEDPRADPSLHGGAWGPWAGDEEKDCWNKIFHRKNKDKKAKKKMSKTRSFFRKLNTRMMSNRI
ncbi:arylsulfatase I [Astyanax mexicanus]|uniref:Arylsulfatase I-like n=2 Tax=Astyanax mexicanus TaxID=7994 RepID=A0A8B9GZB9_ASTMX|nr:arylsulfatase I [Astyanax mexicanus]KAG9281164.1 arylsulfatase I-like [Astyanax mexicanus]